MLNASQIDELKNEVKSQIENIDILLETATKTERVALLAKREQLVNTKVVATTCVVCGRGVESNLIKRGRKKDMHHECKELQACMSRLQKAADRIEYAEGEQGDARLKVLRSTVWSFLNQKLHKNTVQRSDSAAETTPRKADKVDAVVVATEEQADAYVAEFTRPVKVEEVVEVPEVVAEEVVETPDENLAAVALELWDAYTPAPAVKRTPDMFSTEGETAETLKNDPAFVVDAERGRPSPLRW